MKFLPLLLVLLPLSLHASLQDLLGPSLVDAKGDPVELSSLEGKVVGLYFSAEWCGPCRKFTPTLVEARDRNKADFEVVFVSSDRSEKDQQKYMKGYRMKWPAVPFDSEKRRGLGAKFGVRGIPALVIVDSEGNLITAQGRGEISGNAREAIRNWKKAAKAGAAVGVSEE
jgi:thiol-disulfide isomerase/thioredoxin